MDHKDSKVPQEIRVEKGSQDPQVSQGGDPLFGLQLGHDSECMIGVPSSVILQHSETGLTNT